MLEKCHFFDKQKNVLSDLEKGKGVWKKKIRGAVIRVGLTNNIFSENEVDNHKSRENEYA